MALSAFMHTNHTKMYSGYGHQPNIGMMKALLLGWKKVENKSHALRNLKQQSNQLINSIEVLDDKEKEYNSYEFLNKFTCLFERRVIVLESPINEDNCSPETLEEVLFQVCYNTASVENKDPILLWRTSSPMSTTINRFIITQL